MMPLILKAGRADCRRRNEVSGSENNIASGYVFEIDDFAKFEGKTGPYIQYAIARINSILRKAGEIKPGKIVITNPEERDLALKLMQLNNIVLRTHEAKEPSIISDYAYTLAQAFSSFYNTSPIMSAATPEQAASRLQIAKIVRDVLTLLLNLLGIEAPEVMLKKQSDKSFIDKKKGTVLMPFFILIIIRNQLRKFPSASHSLYVSKNSPRAIP